MVFKRFSWDTSESTSYLTILKNKMANMSNQVQMSQHSRGEVESGGEVESEENENQASPRLSSTSCGARRNPDERQVHSFIVVPTKSTATTSMVIKVFRFTYPYLEYSHGFSCCRVRRRIKAYHEIHDSLPLRQGHLQKPLNFFLCLGRRGEQAIKNPSQL